MQAEGPSALTVSTSGALTAELRATPATALASLTVFGQALNLHRLTLTPGSAAREAWQKVLLEANTH